MCNNVEVTVVVPLYNEEAVATRVLDTLTGIMEGTKRAFEIVCVDDGSSDQTCSIVGARAAADDRIRLVRLSRNFGKEAALAAGLDVAAGAAVITIDADLQHPPRIIPAMLARWDEGYEIVEVVKSDRGKESKVYRAAAQLFYALMGKALKRRVQGDSDYKLLDRVVVDVLRTLPERHRYYRGLVVWAGFRVAQLSVEMEARAAGDTKWSLVGLMRYSVRNVVAFSSFPLHLIAWLGLLLVAGGLVLGVQTLCNWASGVAVDGFTTTILVTIVMSGMILVCLGCIAIYLAHIYDEVKGRPVYIIAGRRERSDRNRAPTDRPDHVAESDSSPAQVEQSSAKKPDDV